MLADITEELLVEQTAEKVKADYDIKMLKHTVHPNLLYVGLL